MAHRFYIMKFIKKLSVFALMGAFLTSCNAEKQASASAGSKTKDSKEMNENLEVATVAGGCFWCIEAVFDKIEGVESAVSGYSGGHVENPTYEQVCRKNTGHYEVVQIKFDPAKISYEEILTWFWKAHNPTQANGQGNDIGEPYRPAIFVHSEEQRKKAEASKAEFQKTLQAPIATKILDSAKFYSAEGYHQDYYKLNKNRNPYCRVVIAPKLKKLGLDD